MRQLHVGNLYVSSADIVRLISIDLEDGMLVCCVVTELDPNQGIPVGTTFNMIIYGFMGMYSPYINMDEEMDNL